MRSAPVRIEVRDRPAPGETTWFYFRGNGHESGRNGPYDHVPVQRFFYLPTVEGGTDTLRWRDGFSLTWQLVPVRQAGYYTTFFYAASEGTDFYDLLGLNGYVGAHPYPFSAFGGGDGDDFRAHEWEISIDGIDHVGSLVEYGRVHTQAFRCEVLDAAGASQMTLHPSIASDLGEAIEYRHDGAYADAPPHAHKALVFGNAPWWAAHQHERLSGYLRRVKVFRGALSDADLLAESLSDTLATDAGRAQIWWSKISPTSPDDLTSDSVDARGARRTALWIDGARAEIVRDADLASHHAFMSADTIGNPMHMERG
ncbi:MAG: hypothetical protein AB7S26_32245 [Sandaracinaceae bacterium]